MLRLFILVMLVSINYGFSQQEHDLLSQREEQDKWYYKNVWLKSGYPELISLLGKRYNVEKPIVQNWLNDEKKAVPLLLKHINDKDWMLRQNVITCLGWMGKKAIKAEKALTKLLATPDEYTRASIAFALYRIGPSPETVPLLIESFQYWQQSGDSVWFGFILALGLLKSYSTHPRLTLEKLHNALLHKEAKIREGAAMVLGLLGSKAAIATPLLVKLLSSDPSAKVRGTAAGALGNIKHNISLIVPALINSLADNNYGSRSTVDECAQQALLEIGIPIKPFLGKALQEKHLPISVKAKIKTIQEKLSVENKNNK